MDLAIIRPHGKSAVVACQRLVKSLQLLQGVAAVVERLGRPRPHGKSAVVACQRLVKSLQLLQGVAAVVERLGIVRPHGKSAAVARQRLVMSSSPRLDHSNQMEGIEIIGFYAKDCPCQPLCLTKLPALIGGSGSLDRLWQCQGDFDQLQSLPGPNYA